MGDVSGPESVALVVIHEAARDTAVRSVFMIDDDKTIHVVANIRTSDVGVSCVNYQASEIMMAVQV